MGIASLARYRADRLHRKAQAASSAGNDDAALALYDKCLAVDPERANTLYNVGLIHKYRSDWEASFSCNARAFALDPSDEAVRWNLAIAATALRRWAVARRAWNANGIAMSDADEPINMNFGRTPVRLNPDSSGEVVWGRRIDPIRVVIENIPYPESGYRYNDVVLHDGAPSGARVVEGREYSVFNVLALFEPSRWSTYVATVAVSTSSEAERLDDVAEACGVTVEDWTGNVRMLCRQCSEGVPHEAHDQQGEPVWNNERRVGLACEGQAQIDAFVKACRDLGTVEILGMTLALGA